MKLKLYTITQWSGTELSEEIELPDNLSKEECNIELERIAIEMQGLEWWTEEIND